MRVTVQYEIEVSEKKLKTLVRKDMRELRKSMRHMKAKPFYKALEPLQRYRILSALHAALVNGGFSAARAKYPTLVHKNYGNIVMHYFPLMKDMMSSPTNVEVEG